MTRVVTRSLTQAIDAVHFEQMQKAPGEIIEPFQTAQRLEDILQLHVKRVVEIAVRLEELGTYE